LFAKQDRSLEILESDKNLRQKIVSLLTVITTYSLNQSTFIKTFDSGDHFGFCLVRIEWAALNVAVCHFGFYQVPARVSSLFIDHLKETLTPFHAYDKRLVSLLAHTPSKPSSDKDIHLPENTAALLYDHARKPKRFKECLGHDQEDICHKKEWVLKSDN